MRALKSLKNLWMQRRNRCAAGIVLAMVSLVTIGAVNDAAVKEIPINEVNVYAGTEESTVLTTRKKTVGELLDEYGIVVNSYDNLNYMPSDALEEVDSLTLRRGIVFNIKTANGDIKASTTKATVGEALTEAGIHTEPDDEVIPSRDSLIGYDMTVSIAKIEIREETVSETIAYDTVKRETSELFIGEKKVKQEGSDGSKDVTYRITIKDGIEVAREAVSEQVTKEATDEIILVGTKNNVVNVKAASNGALSSRGEMRYKKKLNVTATAYDTSPEQNGGSTRSASGTPLKYGIIAVDPNVIPLGSRVYVESSDGGKSWVYGYAVAADKGGAIKGNRIDLCFESSSAASNFGRRSATIYVIE
ncbi:MAG: G5 domain-containing protein [Oscillospiraceae bacterium]|nr:G5 domain-containing protein [Oscillospiraceae bacterium]